MDGLEMAASTAEDTIHLTCIVTAQPPNDNIAVQCGERTGTNDADERTHDSEQRNHEFSLPPADGGKDAWLFLAGAFVLEALVWGIALSLSWPIAPH